MLIKVILLTLIYYFFLYRRLQWTYGGSESFCKLILKTCCLKSRRCRWGQFRVKPFSVVESYKQIKCLAEVSLEFVVSKQIWKGIELFILFCKCAYIMYHSLKERYIYILVYCKLQLLCEIDASAKQCLYLFLVALEYVHHCDWEGWIWLPMNTRVDYFTLCTCNCKPPTPTPHPHACVKQV